MDINEEFRLGNLTLADHEHRQVVKRILVLQANDEIDLDILKAYLEAESEYGDMEELSVSSDYNLSTKRS